MFTYPKSIVRVVRMLMHLRACHVSLQPGEFHPSKFPPIGLGAPGGLTLGFAQISSLKIFFFHSRNLRDAWADRREILHDGQQ